MTGTSEQLDRGRSRDVAARDESASTSELDSASTSELDSATDADTAARVVRSATPLPLPSAPPAVVPGHESTLRRAAAASRAWLGTRTWPAFGATGVTAAYGLLKAYWVFGGTALWSIAPLSEDMIERARSHTAPRWFEIADAASVVLALVGVFFALSTVRARRWLPVSLVRWSLWPLG